MGSDDAEDAAHYDAHYDAHYAAHYEAHYAAIAENAAVLEKAALEKAGLEDEKVQHKKEDTEDEQKARFAATDDSDNALLNAAIAAIAKCCHCALAAYVPPGESKRAQVVLTPNGVPRGPRYPSTCGWA